MTSCNQHDGRIIHPLINPATPIEREDAVVSLLVAMKHKPLSNKESAETSEIVASILQCEETVCGPTTTTTTTTTTAPSNGSSKSMDLTSSKSSSSSAMTTNRSTYPSGMPIALACPRDTDFLSPLQCYIRTHLTEFFAAESQDFATPTNKKKSTKLNTTHTKQTSSRTTATTMTTTTTATAFITPGRRTPVSAGRVGIRCLFCKHSPSNGRASQSISFPSQVSGIYSSVVMMQCRHFPHCRDMPALVREEIVRLKRMGNNSSNNASSSSSSSGAGVGRQQYWESSARDAGFIDTEGGIRFKAPSIVELPRKPLAIAANESLEGNSMQNTPSANGIASNNDNTICKPLPTKSTTSAIMTPAPIRPTIISPAVVEHHNNQQQQQPIISFPNNSIKYDLLIQGSHLVSIQDKDLVPGHVFLALAQMKPCPLGPNDRVGSYKSRPVGFLGMSCKHCQGHSSSGKPGSGKFFPNSVRSLAQTTTTQTIVKHVALKCKGCPKDIRDTISALVQEAERTDKPAYAPRGSSGLDGRPKYGSRKEFFQRVWDRLHGTCSSTSTNDVTTMETDAISDFGSVASTAVSRSSATTTQDTTNAMSCLKKKLFHPIRQVVSVSSYSDDGSDECLRADDSDGEDDIVSLGDEALEDDTSITKILRDDKNRIISVTGYNLSMCPFNKRPYAHSSSFASSSTSGTKKRVKVEAM